MIISTMLHTYDASGSHIVKESNDISLDSFTVAGKSHQFE